MHKSNGNKHTFQTREKKPTNLGKMSENDKHRSTSGLRWGH